MGKAFLVAAAIIVERLVVVMNQRVSVIRDERAVDADGLCGLSRNTGLTLCQP